MMPEIELAARPGKQEVIVTTVFEATPETVFRAYTDPRLIPAWWASRHYAVEVETMDVRPGGSWRIIVRDAAGGEFWFRGVYHEIDRPRRIVQTFEHQGMPGRVSLKASRSMTSAAVGRKS